MAHRSRIKVLCVALCVAGAAFGTPDRSTRAPEPHLSRTRPSAPGLSRLRSPVCRGWFALNDAPMWARPRVNRGILRELLVLRGARMALDLDGRSRAQTHICGRRRITRYMRHLAEELPLQSRS